MATVVFRAISLIPMDSKLDRPRLPEMSTLPASAALLRTAHGILSEPGRVTLSPGTVRALARSIARRQAALDSPSSPAIS